MIRCGQKGVQIGIQRPRARRMGRQQLHSFDFSIHAEKPLRGKHGKEQYQKECVPDSPGATRRKECSVDKITQAIIMIKRAVKQGSFQSSIVQ